MNKHKIAEAFALHKKRVALLVQTSSEWSRQVLAGVAEYSSQNAPGISGSNLEGCMKI